MTCPNTKCAADIPDDCSFCDQCGKSILKCPKCGLLAMSKFCAKDGSPMQPRVMETLHASPTVPIASAQQPASSMPPPPIEKSLPITDTIRSSAPAQGALLLLQHAGGIQLACPSDCVLGRKMGPHTAYLAAYSYISGQHGKVLLKNGVWYYLDLGSTNGTRLNGSSCVARSEYPIKPQDILELGDQKFQVQ